MNCSKCGKQSEGEKLPRGGKRIDGQPLCPKCVKEGYILRAIQVPVSKPLDCSWEELRGSLKSAWADTTAASNWMMTELYAGDCRRNGQEKMPPMGKAYLYPQGRKKFPNLEPRSLSSLEQAIQRKYRAIRYQVIWTSSMSLPNYHYPQPLPVHNQAWHLEFLNERAVVSVRVGDRWHSLQLRAGARYVRQASALKAILKGTAIPGELALYERKIEGRNALMCKMVARLPRPAAKKREGAIWVNTSGLAVAGETPLSGLLVAVNAEKGHLWIHHCDHVQRWAAEHRKRLHHWADDSKHEQRPVAPFSQRRDAATRKYHNRMKSAVHMVASALAGYVDRLKLATVYYNNDNHEFCSEFPWAELKLKITEKLDCLGVAFVAFPSDEVAAKNGEPLEDSEEK